MPEHHNLTGETDVLSMAHCAIRYCLGRSSYAVIEGAQWALRYGKQDAQLRIQLCREIEEELLRPSMMEMDAQIWRDTLHQLRRMF